MARSSISSDKSAAQCVVFSRPNAASTGIKLRSVVTVTCALRYSMTRSFIHLAYIWHTSGIHLAYIWHTSGIHLAYIWYTSGIHLAYIWHTSGVYQAYPWRYFFPTFLIR